MSTDTLTISSLDGCPVYRCEHDGQTHEHPRRHVVDAGHRLALEEVAARLVVTLDVARAASATWDEHVRRCGQCNYDLACMVCELDGARVELSDCTSEQIAGMHACNCASGTGGAGYLLRVGMMAGVELYGWEAVAA